MIPPVRSQQGSLASLQKSAMYSLNSSATIAWHTAALASLARVIAAWSFGIVRTNGSIRTENVSGGNCVRNAPSICRARLAVESDRTCREWTFGGFIQQPIFG